MLATNILRLDLVSDVSTTSHSWSGSVTLEMIIVLAQSLPLRIVVNMPPAMSTTACCEADLFNFYMGS